jgi:hypothetical protein
VYIQKSFSGGYKEHRRLWHREVRRSGTRIPRAATHLQGALDDGATSKDPIAILKRERRVAGGNLGNTSEACEARRRARNGPIFSIRIMYRRSRGRAATQGSKTFPWERRRGESLRPFPGMFLHEGSTRILKRSSTIPVFRREKNTSAYRTGSEARPPNTTESFKDSYRNITAGALKVRLSLFFF